MKLKKLLTSPFLLAAYISLSALILTLLFTDMRYVTNDDYSFSIVLSRDKYPVILFINYFFCRFVIFVQSIFTGFNAFVLTQIFFSFISLFAISYVLIKKCGNTAGLIFAACINAFCCLNHYCCIQWTQTSGLICVSGGVLLLYAFTKNKDNTENNNKIIHTWIICAFGILLFNIGSALRYKCFLLVFVLTFGFIAIHYFTEFVRKCVENKKFSFKNIIKVIPLKRMIALLLCFVLTYASAFFLNKTSTDIKKSYPDYNYSSSYNSLRSLLFDYKIGEYDDNKEILNELGFTENDFKLIKLSTFDTDRVFSFEHLQELVDHYKSIGVKSITYNVNEKISKLPTGIQNHLLLFGSVGCIMGLLLIISVLYMLKRFNNFMLICGVISFAVLYSFASFTGYVVDSLIYISIALCIYYIFACTVNRYKLLSSTLIFLMGSIITAYFSLSGRAPFRVLYIIWVSIIIYLFYNFTSDSIRENSMIHKNKRNKYVSHIGITAVFCLIILLSSLPIFFSFNKSNDIYYKQSEAFNDYVSENSDKLFIYDTALYGNVQYCEPLAPFDENDNTFEIQNCLTESTYNIWYLKSHGLNSLFADAIDNDDVYFVIRNSYEELDKMYDEHYEEPGKSVYFQLVRSIDDYKIYKVITINS